MLISMHPKTDNAESDPAFEKFLEEEGLVLLRSFKSIGSPKIRKSVRDLISAIYESTPALNSRTKDAELDIRSSNTKNSRNSILALTIARHGINHPEKLTAAEVELVCRTLVGC